MLFGECTSDASVVPDAECVRCVRVGKFGEQFGELASDGPVGTNVRSGAVRKCAECVRCESGARVKARAECGGIP